MNQDFTVKKSNICLKKKIRAEGFTWKKIPAQAVSEKFVQAENSPTPRHFSNGPSLKNPSFATELYASGLYASDLTAFAFLPIVNYYPFPIILIRYSI